MAKKYSKVIDASVKDGRVIEDSERDNVSKIGDSKTLKEIYEELDQMSDQERQTRISLNNKRIEAMAKDSFNLMLDGEELDKKERGKNQREINRIKRDGAKLRKEIRTLEEFPKVKDKLKKIAELQDEMIKQKNEKVLAVQEKIKDANSRIEEANKIIDELNAKISNVAKAMSLVYNEETKASVQQEMEEFQRAKSVIETSQLEVASRDLKKAEEELEVFKARKIRGRQGYK